jgi:hypothetical protein
MMSALPRKKIRLRWLVPYLGELLEHVDQDGLAWESDTPEMRAELAALAALGNERFGAGTHWVEPEPNEWPEQRRTIQAECLWRARASAQERLFLEHLETVERRMKEAQV